MIDGVWYFITLSPVASSTNTNAANPRAATRPFILSEYGLNPKSTFTPPEIGSFKGTGGRYMFAPDPELPPDFFPDFLLFRASAFFPVPLR